MDSSPEGPQEPPKPDVPDPSSWMPQPEPPLRRPPIRPDFETTFVPPPLPQPPTWPPYGFHSQDDGEVPRMIAERQRRMVAATQSAAAPPLPPQQTNEPAGTFHRGRSRLQQPA
jgi:hypothetical protein